LSQTVQEPPLGPEKPAVQLQSDNSLLAIGDAEFVGQMAHAVASTEYLPASHGTHVDDNLAAIADEYAPVSQLVHFPSPCPSLYVPAGQFTHAPSSLMKPALHVHDDCPGKALCDSAGHDKQLPPPVSILYVPIEHRVQAPGLPVQPAAHISVHSLSAPLPVDAVVPEGQSRQRLVSTAPREVEYLPALQSWQASCPSVVLYFPGSHEMQVESKVLPTAVEYVPASQLVHASSPGSPLNVPSGHCVHVLAAWTA